MRFSLALIFALAAAAQTPGTMEDRARQYLLDLIRLDSTNPRGNETILVVEDSATVRHMAVGILRTLGYSVHEAEDGVAALEILKGPLKIDLLFTDLIMPKGIDGQELSRRARALRPKLKALFTSGYSEQFLKGRGSAEAGVPLLNKPYRTRALAEAVRGVLDAPQSVG